MKSLLKSYIRYNNFDYYLGQKIAVGTKNNKYEVTYLDEEKVNLRSLQNYTEIGVLPWRRMISEYSEVWEIK